MLDCEMIDDGFKNFARRTAEHLGLLLQRLCHPEIHGKIRPKTVHCRMISQKGIKLNT